MGELNHAGARFVSATVVLILSCVICACGSRGNLQAVVALETDAIPWPPVAERSASDFYLQLFGNEWVLKSGSVNSYGYSLQLDGGGDLPWAIYSIDGLSPTNELRQVRIEFTETPLAPGDGTRLFIGLADYRLDSWVWFDPVKPSPWLHAYTDPQSYRNSGGKHKPRQ